MISIKHIKKEYGSQEILSDVSFVLHNGERVALVGGNGVGKSTLLKIIAGLKDVDSGSVEIFKNVHLGYLSQEIDTDVNAQTVRDYIIQKSGKLKTDIETDMGSRLNALRMGLGVDTLSLEQRFSQLSGGERSKIALIASLLPPQNFLLLDEPTNNLDLPALIWLEEYLLHAPIGFLVASHDRRFLDHLVTRTLEIDWFSRGIHDYPGNYSRYLEFKVAELEQNKKTYQRQRREIKRLKETIEEKKKWAVKGARQEVSDKDKLSRGFKRDRASKISGRAKAIEKRLEQMDVVDAPKEHPSLHIVLQPNESRAKHSIRLENIYIGHPPKLKIGPINLEIAFGARVGILGKNGAGKSTLLKVITGKHQPLSGKIKIGPSLVFGNLMQEHDNLPHEQTLEKFFETKTSLQKEFIFNTIKTFGFGSAETKKRIQDLSPGGRARLLLAYFATISANVLVLDEPTNHLDIDALAALEEVLQTYQGTVLLVSHDRYFLEKTKLDCYYVITDNGLHQIVDFSHYKKSILKDAKKMISLLR